MLAVWEDFSWIRKHEETHAHPYRRQTFSLYPVHQSFLYIRQPEDPQAHPYRQERVCLHPVQEIILSFKYSEETPAHTHGIINFPAPCVTRNSQHWVTWKDITSHTQIWTLCYMWHQTQILSQTWKRLELWPNKLLKVFFYSEIMYNKFTRFECALFVAARYCWLEK